MKAMPAASLVLAAFLAATAPVSAQETPHVGDLACSGEGLIAVIGSQCMHDGGQSGSDDSLEIYCYHETARFCLSGESCPWRGSPAGVIEETCSRAGLRETNDWMATARCDGWSGFHDFECTKSGTIVLRQEPRSATEGTCGAPD